MLNVIDSWLFDSTGLTAHGFCLLWQPGLIWTYALSDAGIALAYFSIPRHARRHCAAARRSRVPAAAGDVRRLHPAVRHDALARPPHSVGARLRLGGGGQGGDGDRLHRHRHRALASAAASSDAALPGAISGNQRGPAGERRAAVSGAENGDRRPTHRRHRPRFQQPHPGFHQRPLSYGAAHAAGAHGRDRRLHTGDAAGGGERVGVDQPVARLLPPAGSAAAFGGA